MFPFLNSIERCCISHWDYLFIMQIHFYICFKYLYRYPLASVIYTELHFFLLLEGLIWFDVWFLKKLVPGDACPPLLHLCLLVVGGVTSGWRRLDLQPSSGAYFATIFLLFVLFVCLVGCTPSRVCDQLVLVMLEIRCCGDYCERSVQGAPEGFT